MTTEPTIFVVDDDPSMRRSLQWMLVQAGRTAETFASAAELLSRYELDQRGCMVLDVCMPDMTGLELQEEVLRRGWPLPAVIITAHADVSMALRAMQAQAVDFLEKPFTRAALLAAIDRALQRESKLRQRYELRRRFQQRYRQLTPRERQIMVMLVQFEQTKRVAYELGISKRTADIHRAHILAKMQADSLTDLALTLRNAAPELLEAPHAAP